MYPYDVPELQHNETRLLVDGNIIVGDSASLALYTVILGNTSGTVPRSNTFRVHPDTWWVEDDKNVKYGFNDEGILDLSDAPSDRMYRIVFKYKGKTYSSSFEKHLDPPEIREISFDADDFTVYCRVSFDEGSGGSGFTAVRSDEIWNYHTDFEKSVIINPATWEYVDVKIDSQHWSKHNKYIIDSNENIVCESDHYKLNYLIKIIKYEMHRQWPFDENIEDRADEFRIVFWFDS